MSKLNKYASESPIMDIKVKYKDEVFSFNLDQEMKVGEDRLNSNLKTQMRSFAFLNLLLVKLNIQLKNDTRKLKRETDRMFAGYRGKYKTVTEAEAVMYTENKSLTKKQDALLELEEFRDTIQACVRAFESRKDLLQSLSANVRKETN